MGRLFYDPNSNMAEFISVNKRLDTVSATRWFIYSQEPHINFGEEKEKNVGYRIIKALYLCLYEQYNDGGYK